MEFYSDKKQIDFTKAMKEHVIKKMEKLRKLVDSLDGRTTLKKEGNLLKLEIAIPGNIRASKAGDDFYSLTTEIVAQLERQIIKYRSIKMQHEKNRDKSSINIVDEYNEDDSIGLIVREKFIPLETITRDEAIEEMELLGHSFFIFKDISNDQISAVYKRNDENYGLLVLPE